MKFSDVSFAVKDVGWPGSLTSGEVQFARRELLVKSEVMSSTPVPTSLEMTLRLQSKSKAPWSEQPQLASGFISWNLVGIVVRWDLEIRPWFGVTYFFFKKVGKEPYHCYRWMTLVDVSETFMLLSLVNYWTRWPDPVSIQRDSVLCIGAPGKGCIHLPFSACRPTFSFFR